MVIRNALERIWGFLLPAGAGPYCYDAMVREYVYVVQTGPQHEFPCKPIAVRLLCPCGCGHLFAVDLRPVCSLGTCGIVIHDIQPGDIFPRITLMGEPLRCPYHGDFQLVRSEVVWQR